MFLRVRLAPDRDEDRIETFGALLLALHEGGRDAFVVGFQHIDARLQMDGLEVLFDALGERLHEVAVGGRKDAVHHFDHGDARAEALVDLA